MAGMADNLAIEATAHRHPPGPNCIQDFPKSRCEEGELAETVIKLRLNQQQLELMDRTIANGVAPDRVALVRLALREYAAARQAETKARPNDLEPAR
jgi:hypothetical protein